MIMEHVRHIDRYLTEVGLGTCVLGSQRERYYQACREESFQGVRHWMGYVSFTNGPPQPDQSSLCALGIEKSNPFGLVRSLMIQVYSGGIAATNAYALSSPQGTLLVDAPEGTLRWMQREGITPDALLLTHQHFDHVWDAAAVARTFGCPVHAWSAHSRDLTLETLFALQSGGGLAIQEYTVTHLLEGKPVVELAGVVWQILHVPGHSPDSICIYNSDASTLFGGDVLFADGIGRTDFPGGDTALLLQGIEEKLLTLPDETDVYPGHGPATTIGQERQHNSYLS
jgi:hydroxyacylglutathione hydrolase